MASQLRKGLFFNPDPYVRISISHCTNGPSTNGSGSVTAGSQAISRALFYGYARDYKTSTATNTCFPSWKSENFVIVARTSDSLEFEVKDKFAKTKPSINRFLGRALVDIKTLLDKSAKAASNNINTPNNNNNKQ